MPNLQPELDALVATLNERRVKECPGWTHHYEDHKGNFCCLNNRYENAPIPDCGGTGTIVNERAQAAWEELTRECPVCGGRGDGPEGVGCNKTGRISQDIRAWPTSAVRGMLMGAMLAYDSRYSYITMWTQAPEALLAAFQAALESQGEKP